MLKGELKVVFDDDVEVKVPFSTVNHMDMSYFLGVVWEEAIRGREEFVREV